MKAATARRYGPPEVMAVEDLPAPVPAAGEVLILVQAFGVTRGDARIRALAVPRGMTLPLRLAFGLRRPRRIIPGREFSGTIAGLGAGVTGWSLGEAVMGITDGLSLGAGAEFLTLRADGLLRRRPATLDPAQAATLFFGALTAADFLIDQAALQPGERVLVNGATGAVGCAALQLAAHLGARTTALCSPHNHALALSLGAIEAHDYRAPVPGGPYDVILDIAGTLPWRLARRHLSAPGRLCLVTADLGPQLGALLRPRRGTRRVTAGIVQETPAALDRVMALHARGVFTPVIAAALPLDQIVTAHRSAGSGHKAGSVVVTLEPTQAG